MRKATAQDVAAAAGVSMATVDRVLNDRPGVRHETRERVRDAMRELDFVRDLNAANLARSRSYRFLFFLPSRGSGFAKALDRSVREAPSAFQNAAIQLSIRRLMMTDPRELADELASVDPTQWDGIAVKATDEPMVREEINRIAAAGVPVVTLVSDVQSSRRDHFVGIDNLSAGRVAGSLMGRFVGGRPGKVGLIAGSMLMRDHVDRRMGFEQVVAHEYPNLTVLPVRESDDDRAVAGAITSDLINAHQDLIGLYSISAANTSILAALDAARPAVRPIVVMHELSDVTRKGLLSGAVDAVIGQNTDHEARSAIRILKAKCDGIAPIDSQEKIRIDVFLRDNLP